MFKYKDKDYLYRTVLYNKSTSRRSLFVGAIISWKEKSIDHETGLSDWLTPPVNYGTWDGHAQPKYCVKWQVNQRSPSKSCKNPNKQKYEHFPPSLPPVTYTPFLISDLLQINERYTTRRRNAHLPRRSGLSNGRPGLLQTRWPRSV